MLNSLFHIFISTRRIRPNLREIGHTATGAVCEVSLVHREHSAHDPSHEAIRAGKASRQHAVG